MSMVKKIFLFFVLPIFGVLFYDLSTLIKTPILIAIVIAFFVFVGIMLIKGYETALTFAIFLNGMNVIMRLLMVLSNAVSDQGEFQPNFVIFTLVGMAISFFLMLRLDKVDVRKTMVRQ